MRPLISFVACLGILLAAREGAAQTGPTDPYGGMEGRIFDTGTGFKLPYRLGRPPGYNAANKYPLVVFLHGSGEAGTDNRLQISKNIGTNTPGSVFTTTANQAKFPTFFIAPQTPDKNTAWQSGTPQVLAVLKLVTALEGEFSIDPSRLYLTGLSIGGMGTFSMITDHPTLFAAAVPMSGSGDPTMAAQIAKIPLWAFHGTIDPAVPVSGSRDMIAAMRAAGGHPLYTEYPNGMHDIWFMAYNTPELLPWMNSQRLGMEDDSTDAGVPLPRDASVDAAGADTAGAGAAGAGTAGTSGAAGGTAGASGGAGSSGAGGSASGGAGPSSGGANGGAGAGAGGATGTAGAGAPAGSGSAGAPSAGGHAPKTGGCQLGGDGSSGLGLALVSLALVATFATRRRVGYQTNGIRR
jgi:poly(3-hydroxybutyrate) depolymerase